MSTHIVHASNIEVPPGFLRKHTLNALVICKYLARFDGKFPYNKQDVCWSWQIISRTYSRQGCGVQIVPDLFPCVASTRPPCWIPQMRWPPPRFGFFSWWNFTAKSQHLIWWRANVWRPTHSVCKPLFMSSRSSRGLLFYVTFFFITVVQSPWHHLEKKCPVGSQMHSRCNENSKFLRNIRSTDAYLALVLGCLKRVGEI